MLLFPREAVIVDISIQIFSAIVILHDMSYMTLVAVKLVVKCLTRSQNTFRPISSLLPRTSRFAGHALKRLVANRGLDLERV